MSIELTIGEFLCGILPRLETNRTLPPWPPDCFALCLSLLKRTGAYSQLFLDWPPDRPSTGALEMWCQEARELGEKWRRGWNTGTEFKDLEKEWRLVVDSFSQQLDSVREHRPLCIALMKLVAVSDEASENVAAPVAGATEAEDVFLSSAAANLDSDDSLCIEIHRSRLRILPRMHTPQNGLTERSLSLYLSLVDSSEVTPKWRSSPFIQRESFNLLLVPWPFEVAPRQFRDITRNAATQLPSNNGFFSFDIEPSYGVFADSVQGLYEEALRTLGRIDGVVLPELAITESQFGSLVRRLPRDCFVASGVGRRTSEPQRGTNEVRLSFPPLPQVIQKKHHPWKLDQAQVIQYGLGGVLTPSREWWEYADFTDREISFISMSDDLVISFLVCEDLARPDPVANLVRVVGPNLVIALLMDGPQTAERWGARYATVLADDPGCSVLTLTSLGMSQLSRPRAGVSRSNVIAIWKDAFGGATEIGLPPGSTAAAISLSIRYKQEYAADGRKDRAPAAFPILSGIHPICERTRNQR